MGLLDSLRRFFSRRYYEIPVGFIDVDNYEPIPSDGPNCYVYSKPDETVVLKDLGDSFEFSVFDGHGNLFEVSKFYKRSVLSYTMDFYKTKNRQPLYDIIIASSDRQNLIFKKFCLQEATRLYNFINRAMGK